MPETPDKCDRCGRVDQLTRYFMEVYQCVCGHLMALPFRAEAEL